MAARFSGAVGVQENGEPIMGWGHRFAETTAAGGRWTGIVELIPEKLDEPLSWTKPRQCFVNSTSDLFYERLSNEAIAAVFGVMAACPHVTFQILTKRAERAAEWFEWAERRGHQGAAIYVSEHRWGKNDLQTMTYYCRLGKLLAGRLLDGREWNELPGADRVQEMPEGVDRG